MAEEFQLHDSFSSARPNACKEGCQHVVVCHLLRHPSNSILQVFTPLKDNRYKETLNRAGFATCNRRRQQQWVSLQAHLQPLNLNDLLQPVAHNIGSKRTHTRTAELATRGSKLTAWLLSILAAWLLAVLTAWLLAVLSPRLLSVLSPRLLPILATRLLSWLLTVLPARLLSILSPWLLTVLPARLLSVLSSWLLSWLSSWLLTVLPSRLLSVLSTGWLTVLAPGLSARLSILAGWLVLLAWTLYDRF